MHFPNVDPIPIPAPVWLMKALSLLTLALHFFAVQVLIGSLLAVCWFSFRAKADKHSLTAASVVAKRLPIVMTYVINLGVPPLLFAQVLYGRALYTSSVLMAGLWISVIFLLMACYWLLYGCAELTAKGKPAGWHALGALLIAGSVGQIYALNMTLMLRPRVWPAMYAHTASGLQTPPHDPTMMPRWCFIMVGGLICGGLWIALNSNLKTIDAGAQSLLRRTGSIFAAVGVVAELLVGYMVHATQPQAVQEALSTDPHAGLYKICAVIWVLGLVLTLVLALGHYLRQAPSLLLGWAATVTAFVGIAGFVIYRDGIRDLTLLGEGFNVWDRKEVSNWSVIGLFLLLFVVGLVAIGWLLSVMKQAKGISEEVKA